jgi:glycosyltransferase involved in cell wall biosynthesis
MRIAITADPYLPVPPTHYGGIERVIEFLVRGLAGRGHDIVLLAHPASHVPARLVPYGRPPHFGWCARVGELVDVGAALWRERRHLDLVHSFGRLAALVPVLPLRHLPKIQSYQRDGVPWDNIARAVKLAGSSLAFTGCSSSVFRQRPGAAGGEWHRVFNGVDVHRYAPRDRVPDDAPLVFLGRFDPIKGAHDAIAIARAAARRLVLAGPRPSGVDAAYFDRDIAPHIDGDRVRFVGAVDDSRKDALLGSAAALLMPIGWEEPFGIVMAEAFACGTPVIAFPRGSVLEVVRDGVNGFVRPTVASAAAAVRDLPSIDRRAVRADCEARFASDVIITQYETLYRQMLAHVGERARAS